ncbi:MAG: hypothetical protein K2N27_11800, partial [Ruminococcus sp.]|nr:hypothetical protein [Ruminococcus sp.]
MTKNSGKVQQKSFGKDSRKGIKQFDGRVLLLFQLFKFLDTKTLDHDPYLDEDLSAFSYANGGLFTDKNIEVPRFTAEWCRHILLYTSDKDD